MPDFTNTLGFGEPGLGQIGITGLPGNVGVTTGAGLVGNVVGKGLGLAGAPSMVGALAGPAIATSIDYATTPTYGYNTNPISVAVNNSPLGLLGFGMSLTDQVSAARGAMPGNTLAGTVTHADIPGAPSTGEDAATAEGANTGGWGSHSDPSNGGWGAGGYGDTGSASAGAGGSVICTELYVQGLLPQRIWLEDQAYGFVLAIEDPAVMRGYHFWARPVVWAMQKSRAVTKAASWLAIPWARHVAGDKNRIGAFLMRFGVPACRFIGRFVGDSVEKAKTA